MAITITLSGDSAALLHRLRARFPVLTATEILVAALNLYEMHTKE